VVLKTNLVAPKTGTGRGGKGILGHFNYSRCSLIKYAVPESKAGREPRSIAPSDDKATHQPKGICVLFIKSYLLTSTKPASHKLPIVIVSSDEDEDPPEPLPSQPAHRHHRSCNQVTDGESVTEHSSEDGQSDEEDFDDGAEGLQGLDEGTLVTKLRSEVLHFCFNSFLSLMCL